MAVNDSGDSTHVSLGYRIDEITGITVEEGRHLLLTLSSGMKYRLRNVYADVHVGGDRKASSWEFITEDGFRFRLETAATPPAGVTVLNHIPVFFQGTPETEKANIYLNAGVKQSSIRIQEAGTIQDVSRTILLPECFKLELRSPAGNPFVQITGHNKAERLTAQAGSRMTGNGGEDVYVIEDSAAGTVEINNEDTASAPAQDTLILPWGLSETALSVNGSDVLLSHAGQQNHVRVNLFMAGEQFRHLVLRDFSGQAHRLEVTEKISALPGGQQIKESVVSLASGPLIMNQENRLELLSASQGGLILDGRSRSLPDDKKTSSVIIDRSGMGNQLAGTQGVHNWLQVSGGRNSLYGGNLADELHGGSGDDYMAGGRGNDVYSVESSATIEDTGGEEDTLILLATAGTPHETLWLDRTESSLRIHFNGSNREVIINGYFSTGDQDRKIESLVMGDVSYNIANLVDTMMSMLGPEGTNMYLQPPGTIGRSDILAVTTSHYSP